MQKKCEYVVKEANQPSDKAVRQFHEHFYEFMLRTTESEKKMDIPLPRTKHCTQATNES